MAVAAMTFMSSLDAVPPSRGRDLPRPAPVALASTTRSRVLTRSRSPTLLRGHRAETRPAARPLMAVDAGLSPAEIAERASLAEAALHTMFRYWHYIPQDILQRATSKLGIHHACRELHNKRASAAETQTQLPLSSDGAAVPRVAPSSGGAERWQLTRRPSSMASTVTAAVAEKDPRRSSPSLPESDPAFQTWFQDWLDIDDLEMPPLPHRSELPRHTDLPAQSADSDIDVAKKSASRQPASHGKLPVD